MGGAAVGGHVGCACLGGGYFAVRGLEEVRADGPDSMFWRRDTSEDIGMLAVQALAGLGGPAEWK